MAVIKPFRGIRFNPEKVESLQAVVSQPYDKIDDALQASYYQLSPYNIVRIIQGKVEEGDQPLTPNGPNVYTRARSYLKNWMSQSILKRDETPSFYAYEQTFTVAGERYTRLGLIAAVELVEYDKGIILPHERTHSGPKEDRLRLLSTLQTNTEQIFILYPDEENVINKLIRQATQHREPDLDVVEIKESDVVQRVWQITDPQIVNAIRAEMAPKRGLIIADGHHRYATGLTYSASQRQAHPDAPAAAAFNYVAATLVSMEDPGLVILPTHREIFNFTGSSPRQILERAREHFDVQRASNLAATLSALEEDASGLTFGFYAGPEVGFWTLALKDSVNVSDLIENDHSDEWKALSVSVLHQVLLDRIAQVPADGIEHKTMIRYQRDPQEPVDNIDQGQANFVFFLSPTRMDQIKSVAGSGEKMPQKSTDFYPKMISGITMLSVSPDEVLE